MAPFPSSYRVISLVHILNRNAKVNELIDKEKREWKTQFVRQVFCPQEVDLVLTAKHPSEPYTSGSK